MGTGGILVGIRVIIEGTGWLLEVLRGYWWLLGDIGGILGVLGEYWGYCGDTRGYWMDTPGTKEIHGVLKGLLGVLEGYWNCWNNKLNKHLLFHLCSLQFLGIHMSSLCW